MNKDLPDVKSEPLPGISADVNSVIAGVETVLAAMAAASVDEPTMEVLLAGAVTPSVRELLAATATPEIHQSQRLEDERLDAVFRRLERAAVVSRALLLGGALTWAPQLEASDVLVPVSDSQLPVQTGRVGPAASSISAAAQIASAVLGQRDPACGIDGGATCIESTPVVQASRPSVADQQLPSPLILSLPKERGLGPGACIAYAAGAAALAAHPARARLAATPDTLGIDELCVSAPLVAGLALSSSGLGAPDPRRGATAALCTAVSPGRSDAGSDVSSNPSVDELLATATGEREAREALAGAAGLCPCACAGAGNLDQRDAPLAALAAAANVSGSVSREVPLLAGTHGGRVGPLRHAGWWDAQGVTPLAPDVAAALQLAVDARVGNFVLVICADTENREGNPVENRQAAAEAAVQRPSADEIDELTGPNLWTSGGLTQGGADADADNDGTASNGPTNDHPSEQPSAEQRPTKGRCCIPDPDDPPLALPPGAPCYIPAGDVEHDPFLDGGTALGAACQPAPKDSHAAALADAVRRIGCAVIELDARHSGLALYPLTWAIQQRRRLGALGPPLVVIIRRSAGALAVTRRRWRRQLAAGINTADQGIEANAAIVDLEGEVHTWIGTLHSQRCVEIGSGGGQTGPCIGGGGITIGLPPSLLGAGVRRTRSLIARLARRANLLRPAWKALSECTPPVAMVARMRMDRAESRTIIHPPIREKAPGTDGQWGSRGAPFDDGTGMNAARPPGATSGRAHSTHADAVLEAQALRLALEPRYLLVASAELGADAALREFQPDARPHERIVVNAVAARPGYLLVIAIGAADYATFAGLCLTVGAAVAGTPADIAEAAALAGAICAPPVRHGAPRGPHEGSGVLDTSGTHLQAVSHCGHVSASWWPLLPRSLVWTAHELPRPRPSRINCCPDERDVLGRYTALSAAEEFVELSALLFRPPVGTTVAAMRSRLRRPPDCISAVRALNFGDVVESLANYRSMRACVNHCDTRPAGALSCAVMPNTTLAAAQEAILPLTMAVHAPSWLCYDLLEIRKGFADAWIALRAARELPVRTAAASYLTPWVAPHLADALIFVSGRTAVAGMLASLALATSEHACARVAVVVLASPCTPPARRSIVQSLFAVRQVRPLPLVDMTTVGLSLIHVGESEPGLIVLSALPAAAAERDDPDAAVAAAIDRIALQNRISHRNALRQLLVLSRGGHGALQAGPPDAVHQALWAMLQVEIGLALTCVPGIECP